MSFEEDPETLELEVGAYERAGTSYLSEVLSGVGAIDGSKKMTRETSPEDRFLITMDAIARSLNDTIKSIPGASGKGMGLGEDSFRELLSKAITVPNLRFKNPTAFILGYIASSGGKGDLQVEKVRFVIDKILPKIPQGSGIEPPDVVRYARYWRLYL